MNHEGIPMKSSGEKKVDEYVERIRSGEDRESIVNGLPGVFRQGIEDRLREETGDQRLDDLSAAADVREQILGTGEDRETEDPFEKFTVANGETDQGVFWNQYRNKEAKRLKESGEFTWGEERIYFDVPLSDMEKLRDVAMRVAGEGKIPIAFKYLDAGRTFDSQKDGSETRFVANFASREDAKRFFAALRESSEYREIAPDRKLDYKGIRVDDVAEYASGFREKRDSLERIMRNTGKNETSGSYEYHTESGKIISLSADEYENFSADYEAMRSSMKVAENEWKELLEG